jgi:hypothetical protein
LINSRIPQHHQSPNFFELGPLRSSRKKRSAALPQIPTSSRTIGLSATTEYEIKGGFDPENASTKALTANVIHQQLDVDIVVVDADEREERGPSMV